MQQNSDTTYRLYDWNRVGLDGKPRDLHIEQSLQALDFEAAPIEAQRLDDGHPHQCRYFHLELCNLKKDEKYSLTNRDRFFIGVVIKGEILIGSERIRPGDFFLVTARSDSNVDYIVGTSEEVTILWITL